MPFRGLAVITTDSRCGCPLLRVEEVETPEANVHAPGDQVLGSHTSLTNSAYNRTKGGFVLGAGQTKPPFVLLQASLSTILAHILQYISPNFGKTFGGNGDVMELT
ncbi:hypothetical protein C8R44DRAFT_725448 [Mycena epipterygia]|nr:hypothetical protein C8R44DRAFT_725448 [Mycena epipterygia]